MKNGECSSLSNGNTNNSLDDKEEVSDNNKYEATPSSGIIPFRNKLRVDEKDMKGLQGGSLSRHQRKKLSKVRKSSSLFIVS